MALTAFLLLGSIPLKQNTIEQIPSHMYLFIYLMLADRCEPLSRREFNAAVQSRSLTVVPGPVPVLGRRNLPARRMHIKDRLGFKKNNTTSTVLKLNALTTKTRAPIKPNFLVASAVKISANSLDGCNIKSKIHDKHNLINSSQISKQSSDTDTQPLSVEQFSENNIKWNNVNSNALNNVDGRYVNCMPSTDVNGLQSISSSQMSDISIDSGIGLNLRLSDRLGYRPKTPPAIVNHDWERAPPSPYLPHPLLSEPLDLIADSSRYNLPPNGQSSFSCVNKTNTNAPSEVITNKIVNDPLLELKAIREKRFNIIHGKVGIAALKPTNDYIPPNFSEPMPDILNLDKHASKRKLNFDFDNSDAKRTLHSTYVDLDKPTTQYVGYYDEQQGTHKMLVDVLDDDRQVSPNFLESAHDYTPVCPVYPLELNDNYEDAHSCMMNAVLNMVDPKNSEPRYGSIPSNNNPNEKLVVTVDTNTQPYEGTNCNMDSFMKDILNFDVEGNARSCFESSTSATQVTANSNDTNNSYQSIEQHCSGSYATYFNHHVNGAQPTNAESTTDNDAPDDINNFYQDFELNVNTLGEIPTAEVSQLNEPVSFQNIDNTSLRQLECNTPAENALHTDINSDNLSDTSARPFQASQVCTVNAERNFQCNTTDFDTVANDEAMQFYSRACSNIPDLIVKTNQCDAPIIQSHSTEKSNNFDFLIESTKGCDTTKHFQSTECSSNPDLPDSVCNHSSANNSVESLKFTNVCALVEKVNNDEIIDNAFQLNDTKMAAQSANLNKTAAQSTNVNETVAQLANANETAAQSTNVNETAAQSANVNEMAAQSANVNETAAQSANVNETAALSTNVNKMASHATNVYKMASQATNVNETVARSTSVNEISAQSAYVNKTAVQSAYVNKTAVQSAYVNETAAQSADSIDCEIDAFNMPKLQLSSEESAESINAADENRATINTANRKPIISDRHVGFDTSDLTVDDIFGILNSQSLNNGNERVDQYSRPVLTTSDRKLVSSIETSAYSSNADRHIYLENTKSLTDAGSSNVNNKVNDNYAALEEKLMKPKPDCTIANNSSDSDTSTSGTSSSSSSDKSSTDKEIIEENCEAKEASMTRCMTDTPLSPDASVSSLHNNVVHMTNYKKDSSQIEFSGDYIASRVAFTSTAHVISIRPQGNSSTKCLYSTSNCSSAAHCVSADDFIPSHTDSSQANINLSLDALSNLDKDTTLKHLDSKISFTNTVGFTPQLLSMYPTAAKPLFGSAAVFELPPYFGNPITTSSPRSRPNRNFIKTEILNSTLESSTEDRMTSLTAAFSQLTIVDNSSFTNYRSKRTCAQSKISQSSISKPTYSQLAVGDNSSFTNYRFDRTCEQSKIFQSSISKPTYSRPTIIDNSSFTNYHSNRTCAQSNISQSSISKPIFLKSSSLTSVFSTYGEHGSSTKIPIIFQNADFSSTGLPRGMDIFIDHNKNPFLPDGKVTTVSNEFALSVNSFETKKDIPIFDFPHLLTKDSTLSKPETSSNALADRDHSSCKSIVQQVNSISRSNSVSSVLNQSPLIPTSSLHLNKICNSYDLSKSAVSSSIDNLSTTSPQFSSNIFSNSVEGCGKHNQATSNNLVDILNQLGTTLKKRPLEETTAISSVAQTVKRPFLQLASIPTMPTITNKPTSFIPNISKVSPAGDRNLELSNPRSTICQSKLSVIEITTNNDFKKLASDDAFRSENVAVKQTATSEFKKQIENETGQHIENETEQINNETGQQIENKTGQYIENETGQQINNETGQQIENKTGQHIENETGQHIENETEQQIENEIGQQIENDSDSKFTFCVDEDDYRTLLNQSDAEEPEKMVAKNTVSLSVNIPPRPSIPHCEEHRTCHGASREETRNNRNSLQPQPNQHEFPGGDFVPPGMHSSSIPVWRVPPYFYYNQQDHFPVEYFKNNPPPPHTLNSPLCRMPTSMEIPRVLHRPSLFRPTRAPSSVSYTMPAADEHPLLSFGYPEDHMPANRAYRDPDSIRSTFHVGSEVYTNPAPPPIETFMLPPIPEGLISPLHPESTTSHESHSQQDFQELWDTCNLSQH